MYVLKQDFLWIVLYMYRIVGNFRQFRHPVLLAKVFIREFLSRVNICIEDMATFTALAKIYSTEYFCNTKVSGLGEIFV